MKRETFIGFAILLIFWIGCALVSCVPNENVHPLYKNELITVGENSNIRIWVLKFEYDGHNYIMFHEGVVHDPDCPCHNHSYETIYNDEN